MGTAGIMQSVQAGTQFWLRRPTHEKLDRFFQQHEQARPNSNVIPYSSDPRQPASETIVRGFHVRTMMRRIEGVSFGVYYLL